MGEAHQQALGLRSAPASHDAGVPLVLRPYQAETIEGLFDWWGTHQAGEFPLVVLPTAAGKTVVFSTLIQRIIESWGHAKILVLAHRQELLEQAEAKLLKVWPQADTGVFCAGLGRREVAQITIASRDSIASSIAQVMEENGAFDLVIIDEAHNIGQDEETRYQAIVRLLREANEHVTLVGFTATPFRSDAGYIYGPDQIFHGVAYERSIRELVTDGYLSPIRALATKADVNTKGLRTVAGDFNSKQLGKRSSDADLVDSQIDEWEEHATDPVCPRLSTVFFCVNIEHAEIVRDRLAARGYDIPMVHGETEKGKRRRILQAFNDGELVGVINVGVLTEGWDCPRLDCIVLMRATKSLGLFIQMVGRGLRVSEETGKVDCLLLDFGGCLARFGPIDRARPAKGRSSVAPDRVKECPLCSTLVAVAQKRCDGKVISNGIEAPCGHEWETMTKLCESCGAENRIAAARCACCLELLLPEDLETEAAGLQVLSSHEDPEEDLHVFEVRRVSCEAQTSKAGGRYLRIIYHCGIEDGLLGLGRSFSRILCLGYSGFPGQKALRKAKEAVLDQYIPFFPQDPDDFVTCHDGVPGGILRLPLSITVDLASEWQDIVSIVYTKE